VAKDHFQSPNDYLGWNYIPNDVSTCYKIQFPGLIGINYLTHFKCNNGCNKEKYYRPQGLKVSAEFNSVQEAIDDLFLGITTSFCAICQCNIATQLEIVNYFVPKLFVVETLDINQKPEFNVNPCLCVNGKNLTLFAVIYYVKASKHFISRHWRLNDSGKRTFFSYDGMKINGQFVILNQEPYFPYIITSIPKNGKPGRTLSRATHCYYIRDDDDLSLGHFIFPPESLVDTSENLGVCSFEEVELKSSRVVSEDPQTSAVSKVYKMIQKQTGSVGGNSFGGPIYGEITQGSMDEIIQYLVKNCDLSNDSNFLDIGSGLGKPCFHAMASINPNICLGIEIQTGRFELSILNLVGIHSLSESIPQISGRCFFMNVDVELLSDFDPFTHVYSFDKAFTPDLIGHLIKAFNNSKYLNFVVSYQKFSDADDFDFNFLAEISTNMTGM
jgi:hypothetical protein